MTSRPVIISVVFHLLVTLLAIVGLPSLSRDLPDEQAIVVVDMVQTVPENNLIEGDKVSTAKMAQEATKKKTVRTPPPPPPPPPPPRRPAKPVPVPPTPEPAPPKPVPDAEILPEKPIAKPKLTASKSPALPKQLPTSKPKPPKNRVTKAEREKAKKEQEALARKVNKLAQDEKKRREAGEAALQNLAKLQAQAEEAELAKKNKQRKEASDVLTKTLTQTAGNAIKAQKEVKDTAIGADEITIILSHIAKCWQPPIGAAGNDSLIVDIIVSLDKDGTVMNVEVEDKLRFNLDRYFKVSAQEAVRATFACSPLPFPADKYDQIRKGLYIGFNPAFLSR